MAKQTENWEHTAGKNTGNKTKTEPATLHVHYMYLMYGEYDIAKQ